MGSVTQCAPVIGGVGIIIHYAVNRDLTRPVPGTTSCLEADFRGVWREEDLTTRIGHIKRFAFFWDISGVAKLHWIGQGRPLT